MKYLYALAILVFSFSALKAQDDFKMPPKVFPVLKENYVSAYSDEIFSVGKVTGDIGKAEALFLPKPFYPGEAKQAAAEGKIYVQVTIDEQGNVVSARSTEGHPALRKIAEESAQKSKFRTPKVDDQPTKTEGWLVYNFEIAKSNWIKTAYDLALLHLPFNGNQKLALAGVKKNLRPEWTAENELFAKLETLVSQRLKVDRSNDQPVLVTESNITNGSVSKMQTKTWRLTAPPSPNPEEVAVTENLIASLNSRLASDEVAFWQFNLAFAILNEAFPQRDPGTPNSTGLLKNFLRNAPPNISAEYKTELADLINLIDTDAKRENFDKIRNSIIKLQKMK